LLIHHGRKEMRVTLNCKVKANGIELLIPFLEKNLPNVRSFEGCMSVTVYFDRPNSEMLIEEEWFSINKHQAYIQHIENNGVLSELASFFESAPVIKYFEKELV
jgi:quinol monooxygenase YgiN